MNLDENIPPRLNELNIDNLDEIDHWILSKLNRTIQEVDVAYSKYKINEAIKKVYDFTWGDFCDWYIEFAKTRFYGDDKDDRVTTQSVSIHVIREILKLLHPYCPFITEELWSYFKLEKEKMLINTSWPISESNKINEDIENNIQLLMDSISSIRNMRSSLNVSPSKEADLIIRGNKKLCTKLEKNIIYLQKLAKLNEIKIGANEQKPPQSSTAVIQGLELFLPLADLIDVSKEIGRLEKQIEDLNGRLSSVNNKLKNENFVDRAPKNIIDHERQKQKNYKNDLLKLQKNMASLQG
jgi:valyl-tRNA synthetase